MFSQFMKVFILSVVSLVLINCDGGSSTENNSPDGGNINGYQERPKGSVNGIAQLGLIKNATVQVFELKDVNNKATLGTLLGEGTSNEQGKYAIEIQAPSQPVALQIKGSGCYTEEASSKEICLGPEDVLMAATYYTSGEPIHVMVTPLTHGAFGHLECLVSQRDENIENSITKASTAYASMYGFDIFVTDPIDVTDPAFLGFEVTDSMQYGFITAGISQQTLDANIENGFEPHETYTSVTYAELMRKDAAFDCLRNGIGESSTNNPSGQLGMGTVAIYEDTYRTHHGRAILEFVESENNATGRGKEEQKVLDAAKFIADGNHETYSGIPSVPLDDEPPFVSPLQPEGLYYNGEFEFSVEVTDAISDVFNVEYYIDGEYIGGSTGEELVTKTINTHRYPNGAYELEVKTNDVLLNETSYFFEFNILNDGPTLALTSKNVTNQNVYEIKGSYQEFGVPVDSITIQGKPASINKVEKTWSVTVELSIGKNDIEYMITDEIGNISEDSFLVGLDVIAPSFFVGMPNNSELINFIQTDGTVYEAVFRDDLSESDPIYRLVSELEVGDMLVNTQNLRNAGFPYFKFTVVDEAPIGGVSSARENINVSMNYMVGEDVLLDKKLVTPQVATSGSYLLPMATEYLHPNWYTYGPDTIHKIRLSAVDEAGNESEQEFSFKLAVGVPDPEISFSEKDTTLFVTTPFENRALLGGVNVDLWEATVTNPYDKDLLVRITPSNENTTRNEVTELHRENYVKLNRVTTFENAAGSYFQNNVIAGECPSYILNEVEEITQMYVYRNDNFDELVEYSLDDPDLELGDPIEVREDSPEPLELVEYEILSAPADADSDTYDVTTTIGDTTTRTVGKWSYRYFPDALKDSPWLKFAHGYLRTETWRNGVFEGTCEHFGVRKRYNYSYRSIEDYPKNIATAEEYSYSSTGGSVTKVVSAGQEIYANSEGWYLLTAKESAKVTLASSVVGTTHFNDLEVASDSFSSYDSKRLDNTLTYTFQPKLSVESVLDAGESATEQIPQMTTSEGVSRSFTLSRS